MNHVVLHESEAFTVLDCRIDKSLPLQDTRAGEAFLKNDWNWAASGASMRRTADRLSRMPFKFRMVVCMHELSHRNKPDQSGLWATSPTHANFVLNNNVSTAEGHLPLTPWMALHRALHTLSCSKTLPPKEYFQCLIDFFNHQSGKLHSGKNLHWVMCDMSRAFENFLRLILTSRCGRKKEISNTADLIAEFFSQHFLGGLKFLRTKDWEEKYPEVHPASDPRPDWMKDSWAAIQKMYSNPVETDRLLGILENQLGLAIDELAAAMVGHTSAF